MTVTQSSILYRYIQFEVVLYIIINYRGPMKNNLKWLKINFDDFVFVLNLFSPSPLQITLEYVSHGDDEVCIPNAEFIQV